MSAENLLLQRILLAQRIMQMPDEELQALVAHLNPQPKEASPEQPLKTRKFGLAKGDYLMREDFDEPLDDFNDYQ
jgi:hypothetical protein